MHPKNIHSGTYNFPTLIKDFPALEPFVFKNDFGTQTIDFADNNAVLHLNKALLMHHYNIKHWDIPEHYLCPPIPGRADYIHYIADILTTEEINVPVKGLDIGVGANCIYPILGSQIFDWKIIGADINQTAIQSAQSILSANPSLKKNIEIRHQSNNANIFEGIIQKDEYFHFTMCNPPFHSSEENAKKGTLRKLKNLKKVKYHLNFGGQANELWCNGGEALFIKRMIKQSALFKSNVGWFTSLVSKKENLTKIYKQLDKLKADHKTIEMSQGNKQSRIIAWKFN